MYSNKLNKTNFIGLVLHYCFVFQQVGKIVEYVLMKNFQSQERFVGLKKGVKLVKSTKMEVKTDEKDLKSARAKLLKDGQRGLRLPGWEIKSLKRSILNSPTFQQWEQNLQTSHLPEMVIGES